MSYDITLYKLKPGANVEEVAGMDLPSGKDTRPVVPLTGKIRKDIESIIATRFPDEDQEELGLEIEVFSSEVGIGIAYWHRGKKAREVLRRVWEMLDELQTKCGLSAFDPQLGKGLDLKADFKDAVGVYGSVRF